MNIEKAKKMMELCDLEVKELLTHEDELMKYQGVVNFYQLNLQDKTKQLKEMQEKMGFAECNEDRQKESMELKANFEETISRLN